MKLFIQSIFLILNVSNILFGQEVVNRIYNQEKIALTYTESLWMQDTLIVAGSYIDSFGKAKCLLNFLDRNGEFLLINDKIDTSLNYAYQYFSKGLTLLKDTIFQFGYKYMASDTILNDVKLYGLFNKFDRMGNKVFEREIQGKFYPNDYFTRPNDFQISNERIIVTYLTWGDLTTDPNAQICLLNMDLNGSVIWEKCYGNENRETSHNVLVTSNGDILVIGDSHNLYFMSDYQGSGNGFYRGYIIRTDSLGNLKWEWRSPGMYESANAAILINDSTIVVAAGYGIEYCDVPSEPLSWCSIYWTGGVYQMDLNTRTKIWDTSLSGGPHTIKDDNQYFDIIQSIEKDGYILCGSRYDLPDPNCHPIDTVKCWAAPGVIAKVANNGDSLWLRKYFGVTDIWESNALFDAEITPDSSYSFVGAAYNPFPGETQGQHGWVLIADKYGCLVPGCQLISAEENPNSEIIFDTAFKVFPSPASDMINVLITTHLSPKAILHLFDNSGREIDNWQKFEKGATYIISVDHLAPGIYFMTMTDGNMISGSEKIIIH